MSLNVYWLAFIGALIGVVGTGVGVIAALIPTMLIGKRDYFQRLVNLYSLLHFEIDAVSVQCKDYTSRTPVPDTTQQLVPLTTVAMISPLPLTAWRVVSVNGELITSLSEQLLQQIYRAYAFAEELNASVNFNALYTSTAAMMNHSYPNTDVQRVGDAFALILKRSDQVIQAFSNLQNPLIRQIEDNQRMAGRYKRWIFWLGVIGGILFSAAIITSIMLGSLIYLHG